MQSTNNCVLSFAYVHPRAFYKLFCTLFCIWFPSSCIQHAILLLSFAYNLHPYAFYMLLQVMYILIHSKSNFIPSFAYKFHSMRPKSKWMFSFASNSIPIHFICNSLFLLRTSQLIRNQPVTSEKMPLHKQARITRHMLSLLPAKSNFTKKWPDSFATVIVEKSLH